MALSGGWLSPLQPTSSNINAAGRRSNIVSFRLGCVDICLIMDICQQLNYFPNNGRRFCNSCVVVQMCTQGRKPNADALSKVSFGSPEAALNGGCSRRSTANGTASTSGLPAGVKSAFGNECISTSPMTLTWSTLSLIAP